MLHVCIGLTSRLCFVLDLQNVRICIITWYESVKWTYICILDFLVRDNFVLDLQVDKICIVMLYKYKSET